MIRILLARQQHDNFVRLQPPFLSSKNNDTLIIIGSGSARSETT